MPHASHKPAPTEKQLQAAVRRGTRAAALGVLVSAALASVKIAAGLLGNSFALIADGVESVFDVVSSLLVWGGIRASSAPESERYPYGTGKAEPLAALAVSTMLLVAAAAIAVGAVLEIRTPHAQPAVFTLPVLVAVIVGKELVFRLLRAEGAHTGSQALHTDAWHHRSDALTSLAALVGISVALVGGPEYAAADDWAALVACGVIGWNGGRLFRRAYREILDVTAPEEVRQRIRDLALSVEGVRGIDLLRVRRSGLVLWVDIHVEVDGALTVAEGHRIAHLVKDRLIGSELPIRDALVHVEPVT